jgi:GT2 family glycosyltransferase
LGVNQGAGQTPRFSVVVPTFNRPQQLANCLDALATQTLPKECFEVIVVDDGGSQPLTGITESFAGRLHIKFLRQPNGGCASARQLGIDNAEGEYLAFTDDDCHPAPDWLTQIDRALIETPACALGGQTINGAFSNPWAEATQSIVSTLIASGLDASGCVRFAPTSNLSFPKDSFFAIGGVDRSWRISGGEDRDLCTRWRQAGFRIRYEPSAKVFHFHHLTWRTFLRQHFHYGRGGWCYYTMKSPSPPFESLSLYPALVRAPFQGRSFGQALVVCGLVLLAQLAAGAGLVVEAVRTQLGIARKPACSDPTRPGRA